jgi:sensor histidine kinase YesM
MAGGVGMYVYLRGQRRKHDLEMRIVRSEQKALLAQMNPHFLFNALNSVLHFIIENEKKTAVGYLTKFSSLIRRILEGSNRNLVNLEEELSAIRLYLELEKLRFGEKFEYSLSVNPAINPAETQIPSMLIQPFLENALWHGLATKPEGGRLDIQFELDQAAMVCVIEDNGIGREQSRLINAKRRGHTSTGLQNVQERINLLNQLHKRYISLEITDLADAENKPCGTRVTLVFPQ